MSIYAGIALYLYLITLALSLIWATDKEYEKPSYLIYLLCVESFLIGFIFVYVLSNGVIPADVLGWLTMIVGSVIIGIIMTVLLLFVCFMAAYLFIAVFRLIMFIINDIIGYNVRCEKMDISKRNQQVRWAILSIINACSLLVLFIDILYRTM